MLAPAPAPAPGPSPGPAPAPTPAPAPAPLSCGAVTISANHGHLLTIPQADLDSPLSKTYNIQGTGNHNHTVTLAPSQLQAIKAKGAVMLSSSTDGGHAHTVTVNCA
ncbi:MAG: hypothetical protein KIT17_06785 [Rubrivivax sp.]|nr:hypothetical protein [Rubrivivax sp.]